VAIAVGGGSIVGANDDMSQNIRPNLLYQKFDTANIAVLISTARQQVRSSFNQVMVLTYCQISQYIVEDEQAGKAQADYGKALLENLSERLTAKFGKGFDITNLRHMRRFYQMFPNRDALRRDLSWTHYRLLLKVESEAARLWPNETQWRNDFGDYGWRTRRSQSGHPSHYCR
jgi:DUF1016 N-terminal domain